jgi:hypothetical protein
MEAITTCQDNFYQMLYWEAENPALGIVHHLMVLSSHRLSVRTISTHAPKI